MRRNDERAARAGRPRDRPLSQDALVELRRVRAHPFGCRLAECPACHWRLDLQTLIDREPTVANIVREADRLCPRCAYNLRGSSGEACPECGMELTSSQLIDPHERPSAARRPRTAALLLGLMFWGIAGGLVVPLASVLWPSDPLVAFVLVGVLGASSFVAAWLIAHRWTARR